MDWQALWDWLSNPNNQQTLAWLGGGTAAVAAGVWAVFKFLHGKPSTIVKASADRGGIVAGRDAHVGVSPKVLVGSLAFAKLTPWVQASITRTWQRRAAQRAGKEREREALAHLDTLSQEEREILGECVSQGQRTCITSPMEPRRFERWVHWLRRA